MPYLVSMRSPATIPTMMDVDVDELWIRAENFRVILVEVTHKYK
jgi:hypothetical protein